jgi:hypothetical protein
MLGPHSRRGCNAASVALPHSTSRHQQRGTGTSASPQERVGQPPGASVSGRQPLRLADRGALRGGLQHGGSALTPCISPAIIMRTKEEPTNSRHVWFPRPAPFLDWLRDQPEAGSAAPDAEGAHYRAPTATATRRPLRLGRLLRFEPPQFCPGKIQLSLRGIDRGAPFCGIKFSPGLLDGPFEILTHVPASGQSPLRRRPQRPPGSLRTDSGRQIGAAARSSPDAGASCGEAASAPARRHHLPPAGRRPRGNDSILPAPLEK